MKIALLGSDGLLGTEIKSLLCCYPEFDALYFVKDDCDITKRDDLYYTIGTSDFTHIINCAAYTNVDLAETEKDKVFAVNVDSVQNIAEICKNNNIKLIHFSTDYVFDGTKESDYVEMDVPNPLNVYGASKLAGERYVKELGTNGLIIRTSSLYGEGTSNFVYAILNKVKKKEGLKVVCDQISCPTFVNDLAFAIVNILKTQIHGLLNIVNEGGISWCDFAKKITELKGYDNYPMIKITTDKTENVAVRPKHSVLSIKKLKTITDLKMRKWDDALQQFLFQIE